MKPFIYRLSPKPILAFTMGVICSACAALQPPNAAGPGSGGPPYPVVMTEISQRRESSLLALNRLAQEEVKGDQTSAYLQPITATIKALPPKLVTPLYLPKVGTNAQMNEEETREALRRFINAWRNLIGANPLQLSLVESVNQPDGSKIARYEQRTFRYPLRGEYGKLEIHFTSDRRLINLSSSCIPDAERLATALGPLTPALQAEDVIKQLRDKGVSYTNSSGTQQLFQIPPASGVTPVGLVTYVLPSKASVDSLEFHIAWEISVGGAPFKMVYVDAIGGEVLGAAGGP